MAIGPQKDGMFDAPIPGQSLTQIPGGMPMEKPPQFTEEDKALEYFWNEVLEDKQTVTKLMVFLKGGISITEIVNTLLYTGVAAGKWSLDLAFMMYQEVCWMIEALAKVRNIDYTFKRVDPSFAQFLYEYKDYINPTKEETPQEASLDDAIEGMFSGVSQ